MLKGVKMNAYELADDLESYDWYYEHEVTGSDGFTQEIKTCNTEYVWDAATMLRQQADRIEELEKDLHMIQRHYDQLDTQTKPLSDEEINEISMKCYVYPADGSMIFNQHKFARAIEEKHGIK